MTAPVTAPLIQRVKVFFFCKFPRACLCSLRWSPGMH